MTLAVNPCRASAVRFGISSSSSHPVHPASALLARCPEEQRVALLAGLIPGVASASALCRITESIAVDSDDVGLVERLQSIVGKQFAPSFASGWVILLNYELGRAIEPRVRTAEFEASIPPIIAMRWEGAWVLDGEESSEPQWVGPAQNKIPLEEKHRTPTGFTLGDPVSTMGRGAYIERVKRVQQYIAAGDIYQANIAHHICASFSGCARSAASAMFERANPAFGSMLSFEHDGEMHEIISVSPELFIGFDPETRALSTRPMKGTRRDDADPDELRDASKDRAELNMIVDLMRNDLGRVCELGSVEVTVPRSIEQHASGVLQATATVRGTLRRSCGISDVLRACFPPGSVTGAPKIRAMQIIEQLEATERGPYCGSVLVLNDSGAFVSSVGIRTAHITRGVLSYASGAGIVADSVPEDEWEETMIKAAILERGLGMDLGAMRNDP